MHPPKGFSLRRGLLVGFLPNFHKSPRLISAHNHAPRGTLIADQRRACAARPKGKKAEARGRSLLQTGRFKFFPATGSQAPMSPPSFIQSTFTSHTGSLVLSLYAPRYCLTASAGFGRQFTKLRALSRLRRRYGSKKVPYPLVPLSPPHHQKNSKVIFAC